jgi:hypothetical protein
MAINNKSTTDQNLSIYLYDFTPYLMYLPSVISFNDNKIFSIRYEHISHDYHLLDHSISFNRDSYITKPRPN